ncbi:hypothetical protein HYW46_00115 [Candidatus Daviesbacteria bacterium]|nr:hypothetical protein [Candidatus Daviesbacteria bacterium]
MVENNFDRGGMKKIILAGGLNSKSGDVTASLRGFLGYCRRELGFCSSDFFELSYNGRFGRELWEPVLYGPKDTQAPIKTGINTFIRNINYYNSFLPRGAQMHFVGESLGGFLMFQALSAISRQSMYLFGDRYATLSTLGSPHFGSDLGECNNPLELGLRILIEPGIPQCPAVADLQEFGKSLVYRLSVMSQADLLREYGLGLLTLAGEYDVIVTPDESVIAGGSERQKFVLDTSPSRLMGTKDRDFLGHGKLADTFAAWKMMGSLIGCQVPF